MAYAVMTVDENSRAATLLVAHLPSLSLPGSIYFRSFLPQYETNSIILTTEARRRVTLHRLNTTDILPPSVEEHYEVAASLARDNHPTIRVLKECNLHKVMLFSTPVMVKASNQIIGVILAYDELPDNLCPSPGHLIPERKTGFLTSLFHKSTAQNGVNRSWSLQKRSEPPASPKQSLSSMEFAMAVV